MSKPSVERGGVRSHADLGNRCSACHAPPWSGESLASRCVACHRETGREITERKPIHGVLPASLGCLDCHHEHTGPAGQLTDFQKFDHNFAAFPLTGKHQTTACGACHKSDSFQGTPQSCVACHADPTIHRGRFGTACSACHSTTTWKGAAFQHQFPLNHGGGGKKNKDCAICHTQPDGHRTYTCYGCHKHNPEKTADKHRKLRIEELAACAKCHPTGREHPDRPRKGTRSDNDD